MRYGSDTTSAALLAEVRAPRGPVLVAVAVAGTNGVERARAELEVLAGGTPVARERLTAPVAANLRRVLTGAWSDARFLLAVADGYALQQAADALRGEWGADVAGLGA